MELIIIGISIWVSIMLVLSVWLLVIFFTELLPKELKSKAIKNKMKIIFISWFIFIAGWLILILKV